ncbi:hypothetical protein RLOC_00006280 [Lonchura striata]|uniref:Uncharacterized protein n=1 Tax=Lonchura striata TaxID=40157 RepID=A0A218UGQ2_9PASE|nr:hypothetical protein RLOC_00006280 [Lonchura striata domestica]
MSITNSFVNDVLEHLATEASPGPAQSAAAGADGRVAAACPAHCVRGHRGPH